MASTPARVRWGLDFSRQGSKTRILDLEVGGRKKGMGDVWHIGMGNERAIYPIIFQKKFHQKIYKSHVHVLF